MLCAALMPTDSSGSPEHPLDENWWVASFLLFSSRLCRVSILSTGPLQAQDRSCISHGPAISGPQFLIQKGSTAVQEEQGSDTIFFHVAVISLSYRTRRTMAHVWGPETKPRFLHIHSSEISSIGLSLEGTRGEFSQFSISLVLASLQR